MAMERLRDRLLDRKAAADYIGNSERTVARMMREPDGLAFVRVGRKVMTRPDWIEEYYEKRVIRPNPTRGRT